MNNKQPNTIIKLVLLKWKLKCEICFCIFSDVYEYSIKWDHPPMTNVISVNATDEDGGVISYAIISGNKRVRFDCFLRFVCKPITSSMLWSLFRFAC